MKPLRQPKLSDIIVDHLEQMILEGSMKPGQRLPPERELAVQFEVSRPSVREALRKLEAKGLLARRQGGGNYVTENLGASYTEPLFELLGRHPEAQQDVEEFWYALEGIAAFNAALRATDADREIIAARYDAWLAGHQLRDPDREACADAEFHLAIAEAAHNVALLHTMRALIKLKQGTALENARYLCGDDGLHGKLVDQHVRLRDAILSRDPVRSRNAVQAHLGYINEIAQSRSLADFRLDRAQRRLKNLEALPRNSVIAAEAGLPDA